jgi:hypothetical protein
MKCKEIQRVKKTASVRPQGLAASAGFARGAGDGPSGGNSFRANV